MTTPKAGMPDEPPFFGQWRYGPAIKVNAQQTIAAVEYADALRLYAAQKDAEVERLDSLQKTTHADFERATKLIDERDQMLGGYRQTNANLVVIANTAEQSVERLRAEVGVKESERQYHMDAINRLAKALEFWSTSELVIDCAIHRLSRLAAMEANARRYEKVRNGGRWQVSTVYKMERLSFEGENLDRELDAALPAHPADKTL